MAIYKAVGPDGQEHEMEGPDGASDSEIIAAFSQAFPSVPKAPGFIERNAGNISALARPVLEVGGALGGAALAAGVAAPTVAGVIPGAVAGGGLGFAAGKSAADLLDRSLGVKAPIVSLGEAAKETGRNLEAGAIAEAGGPVLKAGARLGKAAGKGVLSVLFGPPLKSIDARFVNNAAIKAAKPFDTLARELPDDIQKVAEHVGKLHDDAMGTLSTSGYLSDGAQSKTLLIKSLDSADKSLGRGVSDATNKAKQVLDRYRERLKTLKNTVSQNEIGAIVRDIDNDIDWSAKDRAPINNALEMVRTELDGLLKSSNKDYEMAMQPVAEGTRLLKKAQTLFRVQREVGKGYRPTNTTATAIKSAIDDTRVDSQDVLDAIKKITGRDYLAAAENAKVATSFTGGQAQGSRRTLLGGGIGLGLEQLGLGHSGGLGVAGMMAGATADKYGGPMAAGVIDNLVRASEMVGPMPSDTMRRAIAAAMASKYTRREPNR